MSVATDIAAITANINTIFNQVKTALAAKGASGVPSTLADVPEKINSITSGGITPTGEITITENGTYDVTAKASANVNVPAGSEPSGTVLITTNGVHPVSNYANADVQVPTGTARTASNVTVSGPTVTVPAGLYESQVQKTVATAEQATPGITVNLTTGMITASSTQNAGYVSAGTKQETFPLPTESGGNYFPTNTDRKINKQQYLTGDVVIPGDPNFVSSNIKKGVTIWGVPGSYEGGGSGTPVARANPMISTYEEARGSDNYLVIQSSVTQNAGVITEAGTNTASMSMRIVESTSFTPEAQAQVILGGQYLKNNLVCLGDSDFVASNIRAGVTIWGVTGTHGMTLGNEDDVSPSSSQITLLASSDNTSGFMVYHVVADQAYENSDIFGYHALRDKNNALHVIVHYGNGMAYRYDGTNAANMVTVNGRTWTLRAPNGTAICTETQHYKYTEIIN